MAAQLFDPTAPKKPTNVSINVELLQEARRLNLNLSQALEERLVELLREARRRRWLEENREALEDYNRFVERHGAFSDEVRQF